MSLTTIFEIEYGSRPDRDGSKPVMYALVIHACLAFKKENRPSVQSVSPCAIVSNDDSSSFKQAEAAALPTGGDWSSVLAIN